VPEFLGESCLVENVLPAVQVLLNKPDAQLAEMALTMDRLGRGSEAPGLRAAQSVLEFLGKGT